MDIWLAFWALIGGGGMDPLDGLPDASEAVGMKLIRPPPIPPSDISECEKSLPE